MVANRDDKAPIGMPAFTPCGIHKLEAYVVGAWGQGPYLVSHYRHTELPPCSPGAALAPLTSSYHVLTPQHHEQL